MPNLASPRKKTTILTLAPALCLSLSGAFTLARGESVTMSVDRITTLNFMRAATPYTFDVTVAGFTEHLTLINPRELRFEGGRIRLKVDCRGEPIAVSAVLEPTLVVHFDRPRNAFVAKIQSLPVSLGSLGTISLDQHIEPFELPVSFSQTLAEGIPGLTIDYLIRDLKVLDERIEAKADLVFRRLPPAPARAAR